MKNVLFLVLSFIIACTAMKPDPHHTIRYGTFPRRLKIPAPTEELRRRFNSEVKAERVTIIKEDGKTLSGCVTNNREFLDTVIVPVLERHRQELASMHPVELINTLTLFTHEIYRVYFGESPFAWGGDILDLDDPREIGIRYDYKYGFDCSGFAFMPYEVAVYLDFLKPDDPAAVFSSKGFEIYCRKNNVPDRGGRNGGGNRFRLDTIDVMSLGREVLRIEKNSIPAPEVLSNLQPGDIVMGQGHAGIIVEIGGSLYYLEAGGYVVPPSGGNPYILLEALTISAKKYPLSIRRSLPDYHR